MNAKTLPIAGTVAGTGRPWYREPWPWLLAAGPIAVIIAGAVTTTLAFTTSDGVVADDYYKRGLAINRELSREARAQALGLEASARFDRSTGEIVVTFANADRIAGEPMQLHIAHAARASADAHLALVPSGGRQWQGGLATPLDLPARLVLSGNGWRLVGRGSLLRESISLRATDGD